MPLPPPLELSESYARFAERNPGGASPFPEPGPAEDAPDTAPPATPDLAYFENIGPVTEEITWNHRTFPVQFMLLDLGQEKELTRDIEAIEGAEKILVERQLRIARSLYSVNKQRIHFSNDWVTDQIERECWVERFQGSLLYALSAAYERAAAQPLLALGEYTADPK